MCNRRLTIMLLLLTALAVVVGTSSVLSGEHPWDSDRTNGGGVDDGDGDVIHLDTIPVQDSTADVSVVTSSAAPTTSVWISVLTRVWSASWML